MGLSTAWAALKGLSWFSRGAGLVSFIPGVGPILGAVIGAIAALIQLLLRVLTNALKGATSISSNPKELCFVIVLAMGCLAVGVHWGVRVVAPAAIKEAKLEAREARAETAGLMSDLETKDAEDQALAEAADTAAQAAEQLERERIAHEAEARAGVAPGTPLDAPSSVAVADPRPVAGVPLGLLNPGAAPPKNRRKKPEPGVLETVVQPFVNAFDASKW
jgi:F0F1-type ATP synthase epsilon subunit